MRVSKKDPFVPRYRVIYDDLKRLIRDAEFKPGDRLPFERMLCQQYNVERITVRRALEMLAADGLIVKRAGLGSFVSSIDDLSSPPDPSSASDRGSEPSSSASDVIPVSDVECTVGADEDANVAWHETVSRTNVSRSGVILFGMHRNQNDIEHNVNAFNAQLFFIMEQACNAYGYSLMYCGVNDGDNMLSHIGAPGVAGVMLISMQTDEMIRNTIDFRLPGGSPLPVICVNHYDPRVLSIIPDNHYGAELAIDHLYSLGHRRIAIINGMPGYTNAVERFDGYQNALQKRGIPFRPELVADGNWTFERGKCAVDELLERLPRRDWPTAVFAASDMTALGAIEGVKSHGLSVPEDISVVGFDNINMSNYCSPPLTSVGTNARQFADIAIDHLAALIRRSRDSSTSVSCSDRYSIRIPSEFIRRASTAPCKEQAE